MACQRYMRVPQLFTSAAVQSYFSNLQKFTLWTCGFAHFNMVDTNRK